MIVRHPVLGAVGGALVGLGLALLFVMFEVTLLDSWTLVAPIAFFAMIGIIYALVLPPPTIRR
ncbi:MAG: hypothetical protein ACRDG7_02585 [Candidatus Limnocylindria bacterium]